MMIK
jgi:hypothetical protein